LAAFRGPLRPSNLQTQPETRPMGPSGPGDPPLSLRDS